MSDREIKHELEEIEARINALTGEADLILELQHQILDRLPGRGVSATLHLLQAARRKRMALSVSIGGKFSAAPPAFLEWDQPNGQGNNVTPVGPLAYTSDNPAVATVDPDTGQGVGVAVGTANITTTDTGNGLAATDVATVVDKAVSATLQLQAA